MGFRPSTFILILTMVAGLAVSPGPAAADAEGPADVIVEWNARVFEMAEAEDRFLTLKGVRTAALMHAAMHDALNSVDARYETYAAAVDGDGADPVAAMVQAAFEVVVDQYPDHRDELESARVRHVEEVVDARARERGIEAGRACATAVLEKRRGDGWDGEASYTWHPMAPGVYAEFGEHSGTPEGFVFGAGWAQARPFTLERADQFRSPPPPEIGSAAYREAFDEVKSVGRYDSATRTADQTHLAMWWKEFVESSHNRLARDLTRREELDGWRAARLFALLNMGIFDAYVSVFENKFFYNHWRPYTAIRWADHDGDPGTEADPAWDNLHRHTYAFPTYPSAHGCASAAAMAVLADTFGSGLQFTMRIPRVDEAGPLSEKVEMDPPTRSFHSFAEAARECALSRVYLGIHFRYDSVEGYRLGWGIGEYLVGSFLVALGR